MLHLTSRTVPLRGFEGRLARRNRAKLTGWSVRIWDDANNDALFAEHFPQYLAAYRSLPYGVMRADISRLLYMHAFGGWYADTDYEWFQEPKPEDRYRVVLPMENETIVGNCVFASEQRHPIWASLIDDVFTAAADVRNASREEILTSTGPEYLTSKLPGLREHPDIWFAPRVYFHSPVISAGTEAIGVHHAVGSWREHSFRWRLGMLQRRFQRALSGSSAG